MQVAEVVQPNTLDANSIAQPPEGAGDGFGVQRLRLIGLA
jgi:hypothetical protein